MEKQGFHDSTVGYGSLKARVQRADFRSYFPEEGVLADLLVKHYYDEDEKIDVVTVADDAPADYAYWAAIHEVLCCGSHTEFEGMVLPKPRDPTRCREVERLLLGLMPEEYRLEYICLRISMFRLLLRRDLAPSLNESFKISLSFLEEQQASLLDKSDSA